MELSGKRILITGAARGVGAQVARLLAARGARLSLVGLEPELLAQLVVELEELSSTGTDTSPQAHHTWTAADVTSSAELEGAVAETVERLGGLDVVVANAGIASFGTARAMPPDSFASVIDVNLTGVYRTVHAALPHLDSGAYVLIVSSLAAFVPTMGFSAYGASKAGVESLTSSLRIELAGSGIRVGSAHMSWIDTDMVRDARSDLATFTEMLASMPWPMNTVTSLYSCGEAITTGIAHRSRRIYVPSAIRLLHYLRPITLGPVVETLLERAVRPKLPRLDREIAAMGRTVSRRTEQLHEHSNT